MRLAILDSGHGLKHKAMFLMFRALMRQPVPDIVKTLTYRGDFFGDLMNECFQAAMRGDSPWSVGDRELMAAFVSKTNDCEY